MWTTAANSAGNCTTCGISIMCVLRVAPIEAEPQSLRRTRDKQIVLTRIPLHRHNPPRSGVHAFRQETHAEMVNPNPRT